MAELGLGLSWSLFGVTIKTPRDKEEIMICGCILPKDIEQEICWKLKAQQECLVLIFTGKSLRDGNILN